MNLFAMSLCRMLSEIEFFRSMNEETEQATFQAISCISLQKNEHKNGDVYHGNQEQKQES